MLRLRHIGLALLLALGCTGPSMDVSLPEGQSLDLPLFETALEGPDDAVVVQVSRRGVVYSDGVLIGSLRALENLGIRNSAPVFFGSRDGGPITGLEGPNRHYFDATPIVLELDRSLNLAHLQFLMSILNAGSNRDRRFFCNIWLRVKAANGNKSLPIGHLVLDGCLYKGKWASLDFLTDRSTRVIRIVREDFESHYIQQFMEGLTKDQLVLLLSLASQRDFDGLHQDPQKTWPKFSYIDSSDPQSMKDKDSGDIFEAFPPALNEGNSIHESIEGPPRRVIRRLKELISEPTGRPARTVLVLEFGQFIGYMREWSIQDLAELSGTLEESGVGTWWFTPALH